MDCFSSLRHVIRALSQQVGSRKEDNKDKKLGLMVTAVGKIPFADGEKAPFLLQHSQLSINPMNTNPNKPRSPTDHTRGYFLKCPTFVFSPLISHRAGTDWNPKSVSCIIIKLPCIQAVLFSVGH